MGDERSTNAPSPRRGQYGDTAQRCAWCGKETSYLERAVVGGFLERNYCSYACMTAGDYYCILTIAIVFPVFMFFIFITAALPSDVILFLTGVPEFILLMCVCMGHSGRRRDRIYQEELRKSRGY